MTLRFQQHFTLFPGVRLNLGKNGLSASIGVAGATLNVSPKGLRSTVGLPGTGVSFSNFKSWNGSHSPAPATQTPSIQPDFLGHDIRPIASAAVETLTSASMQEVQALLRKAKDQAKEIARKLETAESASLNAKLELQKRSSSIFRFFYKKRIAALNAALPELDEQIAELEAWKAGAKVNLAVQGSAEAMRLFGDLVRAFSLLSNASKTWDITGDRHINRVKERSYASRGLDRVPAKLFMSSSPYIQYDNSALVFENKNGEDIYLYPGLAVMERNDGAFALIDLRDLDFTYDGVNFVEEDSVPRDSDVVHHTWAKVNSNGSPDRRFKDNYQIPVCRYGQLLINGVNGVREEYLFSTDGATREFAAAFKRYKDALMAPEEPPRLQKLAIRPKEAIQKVGSTQIQFHFEFNCEECGSYMISVPNKDDNHNNVTCSGCGCLFGTFDELERAAKALGLKAVADGSLPVAEKES